jgi:hypothetical protein
MVLYNFFRAQPEKEISMSKNLVVAFFFAFINLFFGVAEAVPLVNFDSPEPVLVVKTSDSEAAPVLVSAAKNLQAQVKGEYPWRAIIFTPGYLPRDIEYVMDSLRPGWKTWEAAHSHATLVVCSRIPTWCRILPSVEVKDLAVNYQSLLDSGVGGDFFGAIAGALNLIEADLASRDASIQVRARREKAARDAQELAEKAAAKKIADERKAALEHFNFEQEALKTLVKEGGSSCWREASEAEDLFRELAPTEVNEIYVQAAKATFLGHKIQAKMRNSSESRKEYLVLVAGIVFCLLGTFILWSGFSQYLRHKLKGWIEELDRELIKQGAFVKKFKGKTAETLAPMLSQLDEIYQHLHGAKSNFLLFDLGSSVFVFPVYLWIVWRQFRLIRWMHQELSQRWAPTLREINELAKFPIRFQVEFLTLQGYSQEAVYVGVLSRYAAEFGDEMRQHLVEVKKLDPLSFRDELIRLHLRHSDLDAKMAQFAQLLTAALARPESRGKVTSEIHRLRGDHQDPIDSILEKLRGLVLEVQKAG